MRNRKRSLAGLLAFPGPIRSWALAARPLTLTASATPVLVGTALAATQGPIDWLLFSLALVGAVLIQAGTNLADEYIDHRRTGGAAKFPAPHKVIQRGLLAPRAVLAGAVLSFAVSAAMGLYIVSQVGWPILLVGILSILAGYLHSSGPFPLGHWALGELTVFLFMGVVIVMASYFVQAQEITWPGFWSSLPIAFLVTAILQCNPCGPVGLCRPGAGCLSRPRCCCPCWGDPEARHSGPCPPALGPFPGSEALAGHCQAPLQRGPDGERSASPGDRAPHRPGHKSPQPPCPLGSPAGCRCGGPP
ncbi:MAG: UbiA family prenyltransferase [Chloroflexi bacterium]|nr:UbiA family prenyltransferase [Chloroflexota bacterium]